MTPQARRNGTKGTMREMSFSGRKDTMAETIAAPTTAVSIQLQKYIPGPGAATGGAREDGCPGDRDRRGDHC